MPMRSSSLANNPLAITREMDGRYDVVLQVRDNLDLIEQVAGIDFAAILAELESAQDFTGITVVQGETVAWDAVNKILTVPKGDKGDKGDTGSTGLTGPQGIQGPQGIKGDTGLKGDTGSQGPKGFDGEDGAQGPKGDTGDDLTITQITYNGNGTFNWLFSDGTTYVTPDLRGPTGATGSQGVKGDTGIGVHHLKGTSTTQLEGDFGIAGETDTYTFYADAGETIPLGWFVVTNGVELGDVYTKAEVDALVDGISVDAYTKTESDSLLNSKQDTLINGTNIKSVNNTSLLGGGNLEITVGSGGYAANVYLTTLVSSTVGAYNQISYTPEPTQIIVSATANNNEVLMADYIFDGDVSATAIPAGEWAFHFHCRVSSLAATSFIRFEIFKRSSTGVETILFSQLSPSIENTAFTQESILITQPIFTVEETDRIGIKLYASTTRTNNTIIDIAIGDGIAAYFTTPLEIRHNQLRARDVSDAHPISSISGLTNALNGKVNNTDIISILNGGTGVNTLSGLLKGNGTTPLTTAVAGVDYVIPSGNITGNAGTATKLATIRTINGSGFDGTSDITLQNNIVSYNGTAEMYIPMVFANSAGIKTIYQDFNGLLKYNFNTTTFYSPNFNGNLNGNSSTATKLATSVTIAEATFDGSTNIDISFSNLTDKPTTLAGYNISDAYTKTEIDTMVGDINAVLDLINGEVI